MQKDGDVQTIIQMLSNGQAPLRQICQYRKGLGILETSDLARRYIQETPKNLISAKERSPAASALFAMASSNPVEAWKVMCKITELTSDEWVLSLLGIGELGDLINAHFSTIIGLIEKDSVKNENMRRAIWHVSQGSMTDEQFRRLAAAIAPK